MLMCVTLQYDVDQSQKGITQIVDFVKAILMNEQKWLMNEMATMQTN